MHISAIGVGGHHLGDVLTLDEAVQLVHEAVDAGITFFDNAWEYYNGKTETILGRALRDGRREKVLRELQTFVGGWPSRVVQNNKKIRWQSRARAAWLSAAGTTPALSRFRSTTIPVQSSRRLGPIIVHESLRPHSGRFWELAASLTPNNLRADRVLSRR